MTNLDLLRESFELVGEPSAYAGSMLAEYEKQAGTTAAALKITTNFVRGLAIATGSILLPELNQLLATIQPLVSAATDWAAAHPELVRQITRVVAGLLAFKLASIALRFTLFSLATPLLYLVRGLSGMLVFLPRMAAVFLALLNPVKLARGAMIALRFAVLSTGIGAAIAGIAMAGIWIYNNWSGLKVFFTGFGTAFMNALGPARPLAEGVMNAVKSIWEWLGKLLAPLDASSEKWSAWGAAAGAAVGNAVAAVSGFVGDVVDWFTNLPIVNWADLVPVFSWDGVISAFSWSSVMATLVWGVWATPLNWRSLVPKLSWSGIVSPIKWGLLAGELAWSTLLKPLKWSASIIGKIPWGSLVGKLSWRTLLIPLKWTTRLIPAIGWAVLAGELLWSYLIKPLGWDKYVSIDNLKAVWTRVEDFIGGVAGKIWDGISKIDWLGFINLEGIKSAWKSVSGWISNAAATLWDAIPEMPSIFGGDEIEDPKTLLAAKKAADELTTKFPVLEAASNAVLKAAQAALRGVLALFAGASLESDGARLIQSLADGMLSKITAVDAAARRIGRTIGDALPTSAKVAVTLSGAGKAPVQARARGGAYNPGWLLTGEEGPELRYETKGGYIAHNQALQGMVRLAQKARDYLPKAALASGLVSAMAPAIGAQPGNASPLAMVGNLTRINAVRQAGLPAVSTTGAAHIRSSARPVSAAGAAGKQAVTHLNVGGITINAAPGQDAGAIARAVRRELENIERQRTGDLHDGGAF